MGVRMGFIPDRGKYRNNNNIYTIIGPKCILYFHSISRYIFLLYIFVTIYFCYYIFLLLYIFVTEH